MTDDYLLYEVLLVGARNAGKSTFGNMLFGEWYSQTSQAIETNHINVFTETKLQAKLDTVKQAHVVCEEIKKINTTSTLENTKMIVRNHYIKKILGVIKNTYRINDNIGLKIYDTPGTTGSHSVEIKKWISENLYRFDLVVYLTDINSNFPKAEQEDLEWILQESIKLHKSFYHSRTPPAPQMTDTSPLVQNSWNTPKVQEFGIRPEIMFIVNKCDNMILKNGEFFFPDEYSKNNELSDMRFMFETICKRVREINERTGFIQKITPKPMSAKEALISRMVHYSIDDTNAEAYGQIVTECGNKLYGKDIVQKLSNIKLFQKLKLDESELKKWMEDCGFRAMCNSFTLPLERELGSPDLDVFDLFSDKIDFSLHVLPPFSLINVVSYIPKLMDIYDLQEKINSVFKEIYLTKNLSEGKSLRIVSTNLRFRHDFKILVEGVLAKSIDSTDYVELNKTLNYMDNLITSRFLAEFGQIIDYAKSMYSQRMMEKNIDKIMKEGDLTPKQWLENLFKLNLKTGLLGNLNSLSGSEYLRKIIQEHFNNKSNYVEFTLDELIKLGNIYGTRDKWFDDFLILYARFTVKNIQSIGKLTILLSYLDRSDFESPQKHLMRNLVNYYLGIQTEGRLEKIMEANYDEDVSFERKIIDLSLRGKNAF